LQPLTNLDLLPEPDDPNILTAIDNNAIGYPGKDYGISDQDAKKLRRNFTPIKKLLWPWGALMFSLFVTFLIISWPIISPLISSSLPDSEWAFEDTGIREMHEKGYYGSGVNVCMVDTGIDMSHPDLSNIKLVGFRDFYENSHSDVRDIGTNSHGTLMAGLLVANGTLIGAAPEVSLSIAISLGPTGQSGQEGMVSQAIRWCRITQNADIISLSLGANPGERMDDSSDTVLAVKEAINEGIFVVAAAGNTGLDESIYDISTPANVEGVISVAASNKKGLIWGNSAIGNKIDPYTDYERVFPNQKPEIMAPGVRLLSTYSTEFSDSLYAYSSGTSDSTVLVTGALALLLELYGDAIAGEDNVISYDELMQVKMALAKSTGSNIQGLDHDLKRGYGSLNVNLWAQEIKNEFDFN